MGHKAWIVGATSLLLASVALAQGLGQGPATFPVIVVFTDDAPLESFRGAFRADERARENAAAWDYLDRGVAGAVQALERQHGFLSDHVYGAALRGFSARLTARQIGDLESDPLVAYVEADGVATTQARNQPTVQAQTLPWGIDRIDADLSSTAAGDATGAVGTVNAYIIDTGIDTTHKDLYVVKHVNFAGGKNADCHGHGTHVAGTVAAKDDTADVVGVVPGAKLYGVKVLGCGGSGTWSGVIKGIDWVTANAVKPAVANMSLGGGANNSVDNAVKNSANSGVFYALAAGNSGANACNYSPARAGTHPGVMTVAATNSVDAEASWSNYGPCVSVWAPGVSILSTRLKGGTTTMSGTSMASPHVAGTGALYLSLHVGDSPATVESMLAADADDKTGTVSKDGTTIELVYAGFY